MIMAATTRSDAAEPVVVEDLGNECFVCGEELERLETVLRIDDHLVHEYCVDDYDDNYDDKPPTAGVWSA